jgi:cytidine deaminase
MAPIIDWDALFQDASAVRERAYAPYSRFRVGAALLFEDGTVFKGCNVENASYGLSLCAERNAIGQAKALGAGRILAVAVVADSKIPCPPCGMCRQVISEFAPGDVPVRTRNLQGEERQYTVRELLPDAFGPDFFKDESR